MRGLTQNRQIGTALPLAVMNRIRRQNGGYRAMPAASDHHVARPTVQSASETERRIFAAPEAATVLA
jgi:hypothetical protein